MPPSTAVPKVPKEMVELVRVRDSLTLTLTQTPLRAPAHPRPARARTVRTHGRTDAHSRVHHCASPICNSCTLTTWNGLLPVVLTPIHRCLSGHFTLL